MKIEEVYEFSFSNTCMCIDPDHNDDWIMFEALQIDCNGLCWELALSDLGLWDGNHSGYGYAMCAEDLLSLMTVDSEWNIKGKVFNDRIEYSLSHHDSMGSNTVVTMVTEEQKEELGLY